tara:strand:- start:11194 stop:11634 length:441 start_codon:yes stop_codon:yes gene_type:complete
MQLSPHFSLREMVRSQVASRLNIDNTPYDAAKDSLSALCVNVLEPIRKHFDQAFSPSSGYRCPELNKAIGGSITSQHSLGQAADIEVPGFNNREVALWIKKNLPYDQLILECYNTEDPHSGWVHVSFTNVNRKEFLIFDGNSYSLG